MVHPILEVETEWVEAGLKWTCTLCTTETVTDRRYAVKRCSGCERFLTDRDWKTNAYKPDPENPDRFLEAVAKRRGLDLETYKENPKPRSVFDW